MNEIRVSAWAELMEVLYADSWHEEIGRFRSTFAFRGMEDASDDLLHGSCAGRPRRMRGICFATSASMPIATRSPAIRRGTGWPWPSITACRRACSTGRSRRWSRCISPLQDPEFQCRRRGLVRRLRHRSHSLAPQAAFAWRWTEEQADVFTTEMLDRVAGTLRNSTSFADGAIPRRLPRSAVARRSHRQPVRSVLPDEQSRRRARRMARSPSRALSPRSSSRPS